MMLFLVLGAVCNLWLLARGARKGKIWHWNSFEADRRIAPFDYWTGMGLYLSGTLLLVSGALMILRFWLLEG